MLRTLGRFKLSCSEMLLDSSKCMDRYCGVSGALRTCSLVFPAASCLCASTDNAVTKMRTAMVQFKMEGEKPILPLCLLSRRGVELWVHDRGEKKAAAAATEIKTMHLIHDHPAKLRSPNRTPLRSYLNNIHILQSAFGDKGHFCWCTFWSLFSVLQPQLDLVWFICITQCMLFFSLITEKDTQLHFLANKGKRCNINKMKKTVTQDSFVAFLMASCTRWATGM